MCVNFVFALISHFALISQFAICISCCNLQSFCIVHFNFAFCICIFSFYICMSVCGGSFLYACMLFFIDMFDCAFMYIFFLFYAHKARTGTRILFMLF